MVDGHPYKVEVVGSSPTVPIEVSNVRFEILDLKFEFEI
jgi:hypothetical protein